MAETEPVIRELFIEELGRIQGGASTGEFGNTTTMACCEEGPIGCCDQGPVEWVENIIERIT